MHYITRTHTRFGGEIRMHAECTQVQYTLAYADTQF